MKRRVLSFILALALCLNLCPVGVFAADAGTDGGDFEQEISYNRNETRTDTYEVQDLILLDTNGYSLTVSGASAMRVTGTGGLHLAGTVISQKGAGVEVQSGGLLSIPGANAAAGTGTVTAITGTTYALDIAAGATVKLSAGTYTSSKGTAIRTEDGNYAALLEDGYAFFDANGDPVPPEDLASAKTLVVKQCTDHAHKTYAPNAGALTHTWTCQDCGTTGMEPCTFTFDQDGHGVCGFCGNEITVEVNENSLKALAYDDSVQPEHGTVTVTVGGTPLAQGTDYAVSYSTHADVGSTDVTVTVTVVVGDNNGTFTKAYTFSKADLPVLEWDITDVSVPVSVFYDGAPVEASELPPVNIHITSSEDLQQYLQYSYRVQGPGDAAYTDGLPTNAGTYEVVVSLPERPEVPDDQAASSDPITLIIEKINPIADAPKAATPTFNGKDQALVTAGTLKPAAANDGAQILFATSEDGPYTANIPTGVDAGTDYRVWYKVDGGDNYDAVGPVEIDDVEILRKAITPIVTLSDYTYLYDGGEKQPKVTVKDEDDVIELLDTEYQVDYVNNRNVSTDGNPAKVVVSDKDGGNYAIIEVAVEFKITLREQETLSITEKPNTVTYGDEFTLSTLGGSGNGNITWEIVADPADDALATVNRTSGLVTVTGAGTITVKATKSGVDPETGIRNYDDATAIWTFEAKKKPVVATVTAEDRDYNGGDIATIHAVVEEGVLAGDEITITGLTGTFSDENAGANKTVTVKTDDAEIEGVNFQHYDVSYSSLTVKATINKAIAKITTAPVSANLTYDGTPQALINDSGLVVDPNTVSVEYALNENGPYSTTIPQETDAGTYTVWYRVQETTNYTGLDPESIDVVIAKKSVTPTITLSGADLTVETDGTYSYIYDGNEKTPNVTLKEADGTTISADEYTVAYSNNTNAGIATVTVTAKDNGNYAFTTNPVTMNFTIEKEKAKVTTAPEAAGAPLTFSTYAQKLVTEGEGYGGTMVYSTDGGTTFTDQIPTETNAGNYTVHYKVAGDPNHSDSDVGSVTVTIAPKTVKDPTIELELLDVAGDPIDSYTYDGTPKKPTVTVKDGSDVIGAGEYNIIYSDNVDAGRATVDITDKPGGNYTVTGSATFVILKADIVFTTDPSDAKAVYDGKAHELLVPGETSGGEVLYALGSATSTYTAAIPTVTEAGQYTVYYKVVGDKNHNDYAVKSVSATIERKPLDDITITLTPASFDYDGKVKLPEVTVMDGKTVLPEEEYTWECDTESPKDADTYTITIRDASGGNYDLSQLTAPDNEATFTIGKIPQDELVIENKPSTAVYGSTYALTTSGGSGNGAVTWSATGPATVDDDGNVEITGVGEVTITVKKDTDTNYDEAQAQWTFTAEPKPVTASVTVLDKDYDGTTDATVASASITTESGDDVTIDETSITAVFVTPSVGAGKEVKLDTSKVQVTGDDAEKYAISYPDTVTAEIKQATTSITTQPQGIGSLEYTGQPQALVTAGETNVGFIVYSLNGTDFSAEIPTGTDAGVYTVYYKVDATDNYTGDTGGSIAVTIDPKRIAATVELSKSSFVYDGTKQEPTITVKDGRTVIDEDQYTVTWKDDDDPSATDVLTNVGTYTATIANVTNGNYTFSETVAVEIVAKGQDALNITGQPDHVYYGDTIRSLTTTGGSGNGTVKWTLSGETNSTINQTTGELTVKDTGTLTVTAERTVPNYETVSAAWTFTVEPKPVTAVVTVAAKAYDGTTDVDDGDITAAVKASDLVDPVNDTITISDLAGTYDNANAGTNKTVTLDDSDVKITGDPGKYAVSCPATAKADINPRTVTVSVTLSGNDLQTDNSSNPPTYSYEYDGTEKKPTVTVKGTDTSGYSATLAPSDYTVSYANNKNVGTATVTVTNAEDGNYTFDDETVQFTIEKAAAQLTGSPQAKDLTYTGEDQELVTVGTASGGHIEYTLDNTDSSSYSTTIPTGTNAGTYIVYYKVVGDPNHEGSTTPGQVSVTIKPKEITPKITLSQDTYTYDGNECKPTVTVEDGGDTISIAEYTVSYRDNINAGIATVIVSDNNGGNYIVNGTAVFTIEKANPTVTDPTGKPGLQYNGELQELVTAGVSGDGTVVYSVNGGNYSSAIPTASAVGTYKIEWKVLGDDNHKDTASKTLTPDVVIAKNTVTSPTISLSQDTFQYNGSQQKPTITVYDDNSREIPAHEYTVKIEGTNGNNGMVNVDTYTVTVTTPPTSNYVIADDGSNTRTFTIVPANQETISITGAQPQVRYGDVIQLGTTGGIGGGTVTWTVTDADGNSVNSTISTTGLLTVLDVGGPITVTATCSAGGNYKDVSATWEFSAGKKQVTAVVTVADKPYDGNTSVAPADITATVNASDLVTGDSITITGLSATFDNASAGTNKRVNITSSGANATGTNAANYDITYPATTTASILAQAATVDDEPGVRTLTYDASQSQELVTAGNVTGGTMVYSLDGTNFTAAIPKAKDAGPYTVYFKAQGDGNHTDSEVDSVQVTIARQTVTAPQIELTPPSAQYDGQVKRPEVTVLDSANNVIPASEYKVTYVTDSGKNWTDKDTYTVKIENVTGGNYIVGTATENFTISTTAQNPLEITNKPGLVHYGDTFTLSAVGGSGNAAVTWSVDDAGASVVKIEDGFVEIIGIGPATITATRPGGTNYDDATATYSLNALAKPITAIVTADDKVYDGITPATATIHVTWKDGDLVGTDRINTDALTGEFRDANVGTNKTVDIKNINLVSAANYDITIPATTTASIFKADATAPTLTEQNRAYDGTSQPLVTGGNSGNTLYSDSRDGVYSTTVPTGTNAETYTVWYKAKGDSNHNDSQPQAVTVTISRKTLTLTDTGVTVTLSGNDLQTDDDGAYYYEYDGTEKTPSVIISDGAATVPASEYTVSYSNNKNVGTTATVTITNAEGGNYDVSGTVTFEIRKGTALLTGSPKANDLTYTGQLQELVTVGTATGGHIEYALDGADKGENIPTATNAGTYVVSYKVVGDDNHADGPSGSVTVTIKPKEIVSPKITVDGTYTYDGTAQTPDDDDIKVEDGSTAIPDTEYEVTFRDNTDAGTATVIITNANGGNYIVNGTGTFTIAKADVKATDITKPVGQENLPYNGTAQALITAGTASGGTMVYSLEEEGEYSPAIPTATAVGNYKVYYKVQGDDNHNDTEPASVDASIIKNTVTKPTIQVTPEKAAYNKESQKPTVIVMDDKGAVIDGSEYMVTFADGEGKTVTNLTNVGEYTVKIKNTESSNYVIDDDSATFTIVPADQTPLTITGTRERVYYGDKIQLGTTGGNGTVTWAVDDDASTIATITNGLLEIKGVGSVTVTATSEADGYADQKATWTFYADPKPVTAIVTAEARTYKDGDKTATVTATLQSSDLVGNDVIKITLSGTFEDPNAGTDKKVNVDSSNPDFDGSTGDPENYNITYPATTTASILKADIDTTKVTAPTAETSLEYTGNPLALVKAGAVTGGTSTMEYSTDNITYSASLPTGTNAGNYDVWYRVKGDSNHNDVGAVKLDDQVTIAKQNVPTPKIEFTPSGASFDSQEHKPTVRVIDKNGRTIPAEEYTVDYGSTNWINAGNYDVTVTAKSDGNYVFDEATATFTILPAGQSPLTILGKPTSVKYGDTFTLSTLGGSGNGAVTWETNDTNGIISLDERTGKVEVLKAGGPVTITARKQAEGGYSETTATWTFSAEKKPVTAIVTAKNKEYDGNDTATLAVTWPVGALLNNDNINLASFLKGTFDDANVGTGKTVTIALNGAAPDSDKYDISWNMTTTASITPKTATVTGVSAKTDLEYNRGAQALVNEGTATGGNVAYSLDGVTYTPNVPTGTNAGAYTVWYKAVADTSGNYKDSTPASVRVTIAPKQVTAANLVIELSPETFDYDGTQKKPDVEVKDGSNVIPASEYTVSYSNNTAVSTDAAPAKVTISNADGGNYSIATKTANFTIKAGAATLSRAPEEKVLTYTGSEQALVSAGTAVNGQVMYSLDEEDGYSTSIPRGTNAETYTVWYKVVGNTGYGDIPAQPLTVTIQPKPVYPVINLVGGEPLEYTGQALKPEVTVSVGGELLTQNKDYAVTYSGNTGPGTAKVTVQSIGGNYQFYATREFEIVKAQAEFFEDPVGLDLVYTGEAQALIDEDTGISLEGIVLYSRDAATYSTEIPTGTKVGKYTIFAKVKGNSTHEDSDIKIITAEIKQNVVEHPNVALSGSSFSYTGNPITPTVIVRDDNNNVIPATEYTVSYADNTAVGENTAKVKVTSKGTNYSFTAEETFSIVGAGQIPLEITGKKDAVYYGDTLSLGTTGGSGDGAVTWAVDDGSDIAEITANGTVTIKKAGSVTITATKAKDDNYDAATATWTFVAQPKAVTALVTANNKTYDTTTNATFTVTFSGLLAGESIAESGYNVQGQFEDADVGTNKTVRITSLTVTDTTINAKYAIDYNRTTTASITPKAASVTQAPKEVENLKYTGTEQALLDSSGVAVEGGNLAYSLDGVSYSFNIPKAKDADTYTVWYKVIASENYKDSALDSVTVTIAPNTDKPTVQCVPDQIQYDGTAKTPTVIVRDGTNRIIPESEYSVSLPDGRIRVGEYTVTVTDISGGNYEFSDDATGTFHIVSASQNPLTITGSPAEVHYGDKFVLSAVGGSGTGEIKWSIDPAGSTVAKIESYGDGNAIVTVTGIGGFTVKAYREGKDGYSDSNTASVPFTADPKPVTPVVTAEDKQYDGTLTATLSASWKNGDLVGEDKITLTVEGKFATADVGTNKRVIITDHSAIGTVTDKYTITWPESTTASITRVEAEFENEPMGRTNLTYTGDPLNLVTAGSTKGNIGIIKYSTSENGRYSTDIPTGTNAGKYTVWYKVEESVNYMGIDATQIDVVIERATPSIETNPTASGTTGQTLKEIGFSNGGAANVPGTFAWKDGSIEPPAGSSQQDAIFTPDDTDNYKEVTFTITVTVSDASDSNGGSNSTNTPSNPSTSTPSVTPSEPSTVQTTVQNGTASTVVSAAAGSKLVQAAVASQSDSIVIKPEITGQVTKTEVSLPAATVSQINSETSAALTVSAPIADVTIPNAALDTLGSAGGTVSVAAEQVDQAVVLTLTAGGETVDSLPGGVTLTVPVEDAVPGTVAVLVNEDGTRETLRKVVVEDGKLNIPLDGSATVEIVDNSKDFADVSDTDWAADAIAFASAHELFNGTSETTFSPNSAMSRGMLATVLYSLEGNPDLDLDAVFSDVSGDAWYADGIAWAAENGIVSGYGNGQFGPNDSITREQFAVMLWRYMGCPEPTSQDLDFTDADQISGYALEALCWAVENGILNGFGNGLLVPGGTATRAQAAQMLKNFMENT